MVPSTVQSELADLQETSSSQQDKLRGYEQILDTLLNTADEDALVLDVSAWVDSVLGHNIGVVSMRQLLATLVKKIPGIQDADARTNVCQTVLRSLGSRSTSFEEQEAALREMLAETYIQTEDFGKAAQVLEGLNLDTTQRKIDDEGKVEILMKICRLWLDDEDTIKAETYLNKTKSLIHDVRNEELILTFHLSQARILDSNRKFLEASEAYHKVSLSTKLADEERNKCLSKAIACAVLAPAGPLRSRSLGKLYKDERSSLMPEFGILEKMFLDRIITVEEQQKFASGLDEHQLAQTADGTTVLAKAVIEHNLLGASKLYSNIALSELGLLLGLDAEKAEGYAARMFEQGRLGGTIDQINETIYFAGSDVNANGVAPTTNLALREWNRRVQALVEDLERVSSLV